MTHVRPWTVVIVALLFVVPCRVASGDDEILLRASVRPENDVWVGQRANVLVTVLSRVKLAETPKFDLPEIESAIFHQRSTAPVFGSDEVDGVEYETRRYELLLFARRPGVLTVPPVTVRFVVEADGTTRSVTLQTDPLDVNVRVPPGARAGQTVITSAQLDITESWEMPDGTIGVGSAITRSIRLEASDVIGIALPPAPLVEVDGLRLYREPPAVGDTMNRGALAGSRVDVLTYMCERPGTYALPSLVYTWWNPETETLERKTLDGREIVVEGDATARAAGESSDATPASETSRRWLTPVLLAIVVAAVGLVVGWRPMRRLVASRRERRAHSEAVRFRRCVEACRAGDAIAAYASVRAWLSSLPHDVVLDGATAQAMEDVQRAIVARSSTWDGRELAASLGEFRRTWRRQRAQREAGLAPLNP